MKTFVFTLLLSILTISLLAQNNVGINTTPDPSAVLDISSTDQGLLIPRMTEAEMNAIPSPVTSLMVFNTTANAFWYWDGSQWTEFNNGTSLWALSVSTVGLADTTYNVGIGTSNPSGKFEVATLNHTGSYGSNVASGGAANASEEYPGQAANLSFDDTPTTYWSNNDNLPAWIGYDLGSGNEKRVARYVVAYNSVVTNDNSPNDWTFEASDNGASWTILDTQIGQGWTTTGTKTYDISNTTHYRYYRLNISDNKGAINDFVSVYEIQLKEETLTNHPALVVNDGNVGIGISTPQAQLDISGSMRFVDGNESDGKVLVSDASGNAAWTDGATVNGGGWSVNGNYIYNTVDSVGIGTTTPGAALEVMGHIWQTGTGESVFLGEEAGANDDLTNNRNIFIGYKSGNTNTYGNNSVALGYQSMFSNTTGSNNHAFGSSALYSNTTGNFNTAISSWALQSNTEGVNNIAIGSSALKDNTEGNYNIALGRSALWHNIDGDGNIAIGANALLYNYRSNIIAIGRGALENNGSWGTLADEGIQNTAVGTYSMATNTKGSSNTALGFWSLFSNTIGNKNTAIGDSALYSNTTGNRNTATGGNSLFSNSDGNKNSASGYEALYSNTSGDHNNAFGLRALYSNTTGNNNAAYGSKALISNTSGANNTASGFESLYSNIGGSNNTALGFRTLYANTEGNGNTAIGDSSLYNNTTGYNNSATGTLSLYANTSGYENTAIGSNSLYSNTNGYYNTAVGNGSLYSSSGGENNVAIGYKSLYSLTTAVRNTAIGMYSLYLNTGIANVANGYRSLYSNTTGINNTAVGTTSLESNTTGNSNTAVGYSAFSTGTYTNSVGLGHDAEPGASNTIRLGNSTVTTIGGYADWTNVSDGRFKTNVQENVAGLDFILKLRPVTYNLDMDAIAGFHRTPDSLRLAESERLKTREVQIGFIAQEVEAAANALGFDFHGVDKPKNKESHYGLRYAEFVAPLVKAVQELDAENKYLIKQLAGQQQMIKAMEKRLEKLEGR